MLAHEVVAVAGPEAVVVADGGETATRVEMAAAVAGGGRWLSHGYLGCLGTGMPFAIAARVAHPERPVVCVIGDGSAPKSANCFFMASVASVLWISALSLSIKKLEEDLAVTLLERKPGRVLPTASGHCLYESARQIREGVQVALDKLNRIRGMGEGRLSVGLLPYGIPSAMGNLIGRFCDRYPGIRVQTALGSHSFLIGRLIEGELDLMVNLRVHRNFTVRGGYMVVWADGLALATENANFTPPVAFNPQVQRPPEPPAPAVGRVLDFSGRREESRMHISPGG